ncbi:MAG TPA: hypothetical protein VGS96_11265 [Thermoanaerobaculia bacterium]|nr:hypothetical protein [Thermoanaerobaculia bacterium]
MNLFEHSRRNSGRSDDGERSRSAVEVAHRRLNLKDCLSHQGDKPICPSLRRSFYLDGIDDILFPDQKIRTVAGFTQNPTCTTKYLRDFAFDLCRSG